MNKKVINRKKYINKNNGMVTSVLDKIFFNIKHINDDGGNIQYTHYRKFLKNWKRCTDLTCAKCGNIVFLDSEDDILFHVESQKYIVLCGKCRELEIIG